MTMLGKLTERAALECQQANEFGLSDTRVSEHFQRFSKLWDAAIAERMRKERDDEASNTQ
jgi:hypothetical protein